MQICLLSIGLFNMAWIILTHDFKLKNQMSIQNPFVLIFKVVRRVCIQKRIDTQTNLKFPYIQQEKQNSII